MKPLKILIILFMVIFYIVGCSDVVEDIGPNITGKVEQIDGDSFLVINNETDAHIKEMWFTTDEIYRIQEGITVSVWASDGTLEIEEGVGIDKGTARKIIIEKE